MTDQGVDIELLRIARDTELLELGWGMGDGAYHPSPRRIGPEEGTGGQHLRMGIGEGWQMNEQERPVGVNPVNRNVIT